MSVLSQVIERTVNDTDRQSRALLSTVAGYLNKLSEFVMRPGDSMIDQTVSKLRIITVTILLSLRPSIVDVSNFPVLVLYYA